MRYLNKIIFIESANIKFSEVVVDGNVHFIGTQGVGKSTLLRALLFFYNANQQKLGIPIGKKSFVDFYFPYQNSYIIYEVVRETGLFCVMVFKSQGRICYRFLDTKFESRHFIDAEGRIFESWDKIKLAFGKGISYTRKIDSYEDYRNILYGNNHGLDAAFRKYSLLDSKQYQNIPRAIQHVFLNYKVESEFIKDTIIKSLNEEEIKIDLTNYAHHLKDFDTQLNDIKKWTTRTRTGEIVVRKQAETVIKTFSALRYTAKEKQQLAYELAWKRREVIEQQPEIRKDLESEQKKYKDVDLKIMGLEKKFQLNKDKISGQINIVGEKLKEIKEKTDQYTKLNIVYILEKVSGKKDLEMEKDNLLQRKSLLEANFVDIKHKFEAQIEQLKNQMSAFENLRQGEINAAREKFFRFREELSKDYEKLYEEISAQHQEELQLAKNLLEEKKSQAGKLQIRKAEVKHRRFYENELISYSDAVRNFQEKIRIAQSEKKQQMDEIEVLKKQWELDKNRMEELFQNESAKINNQILDLNEKIRGIDEKMENTKDSLYGWLNLQYPDWENTIGKVIDEDNLLFKSGLSPVKVSDSDLSFYGISIDLNEISKKIKTVSDYEKDKTEFIKQIEILQKNSSSLVEQLNNDSENLKRKFLTKINKCKEAIHNHEYILEQSALKLDEARVILQEFTDKAVLEKQVALEQIGTALDKMHQEIRDSETNLKEVEKGIKKKIDARKKEKEKNIEARQQLLKESTDGLKIEVQKRKEETDQRILILQNGLKKEMDLRGADTAELLKIESRITEVLGDLRYIEENNPHAERYKYDKEQLFDKAAHFKNQKALFEKQLTTELEKHAQQKEKLTSEIELLKKEIDLLQSRLKSIQEDLDEFEKFTLSEDYLEIPEIQTEPDPEYQTEKGLRTLLSELLRKYYAGITQYRNLQESINKFNGNFSVQNIFKFKMNLADQKEFFQFAEDLKEFVEEDKISLYEKRVNELFADIIRQVGKETSDLLSKEGEIQKVITDINKDFVKRNFAGVIKSIELRIVQSENRIVHLLAEIRKFNDENIHELGEANLFSTSDQTREERNKKAIGYLSQMVKEIADYRHSELNLSDSFELEFKIIENDNDTNWVQNLANVGSDGTDVLVKAMINIMLLNVFKEGATRNRFKDFRLHCMMDEIGKLHPENVRGYFKICQRPEYQSDQQFPTIL